MCGRRALLLPVAPDYFELEPSRPSAAPNRSHSAEACSSFARAAVDELVTSTARWSRTPSGRRARRKERRVACSGVYSVERSSIRSLAARPERSGVHPTAVNAGDAERLTLPSRFRACPGQSSIHTASRIEGSTVVTILGIDLSIPVDEETMLVRHVHRIGRHSRRRRIPRRREDRRPARRCPE